MIETPSGLITSEIASSCVVFGALEQCARRSGTDEDEVLHLLVGGDRQAHSDLRYAIAKRLADHLKAIGAPFLGVYVYGSLMTDTAGIGSDIDMIVVVRERNDVVTRLLKSVDLVLTADYRLALGGSAVSSLLDVHIVDATQERERQGYGALLADKHAAPVCLWRLPS